MTEHHVEEKMKLDMGPLCPGPGCVTSGRPALSSGPGFPYLNGIECLWTRLALQQVKRLDGSSPKFFFFFSGCTTQLAVSQFPDQGLNPGPGQ